MYAIIENGNKQYKVAEGDVVRVEKLAAKEGETVSFNTLMVSDGNGIKTGAEAAAAKVTATVRPRKTSVKSRATDSPTPRSKSKRSSFNRQGFRTGREPSEGKI